MRLSPDDPHIAEVEVGEDGSQTCQGEAIRFRTLTGICNDIRNPAMGSTGQLFARNAEFESTFPDRELNELAKNRHSGRISLLQPDPQVISRRLFTRDQTDTPDCNQGQGVRRFAECRLLLQEGAVLQCARRLLDSVHDARLVRASGERAERPVEDDEQSRMRERAEGRVRRAAIIRARRRAWLPDRGQDGGVACRGRAARRPRSMPAGRADRALLSDEPELRHRLVGCLTALWFRRALAHARKARSGRPGENPAASVRRARGADRRLSPGFGAPCPPDASGRADATRSSPSGQGRRPRPFRIPGRSG